MPTLRQRSPLRFLAALLAVLGAWAVALAANAGAAVEQPFAARFSANVAGEVTLAENTLMTCPDAGGTEAQCLAARNGEAGPLVNNNAYTMERGDVDGSVTTVASSQATLALPPGASVLFVGAADPPLQIPISGLEAPAAGAVNATVGVVAYEGDRGSGAPLCSAARRDARPARGEWEATAAAYEVGIEAAEIVTLKGKSYRLRERTGAVTPADQAPSLRDSA